MIDVLGNVAIVVFAVGLLCVPFMLARKKKYKELLYFFWFLIELIIVIGAVLSHSWSNFIVPTVIHLSAIQIMYFSKE